MSKSSNDKTPGDKKPTENERSQKKKRQAEYTNPFKHLKSENTRPKDYYDIHIKWHTVNPYASHTISRMVYRDPMVIDCRRRIVSHLTTNNINIYDSGGNPVVIEPKYDLKFQKYYKDFVQDAYEAYLIQGAVPMVIIEDDSGFFFPVVLKLGTYVIQTAYCVEDERQVYRILRPIYFCARPERLQRYEKVQSVDLSTTSSLFGDDNHNRHNMSGVNLEPHPSAGENITTASGIKDMGWFIDPSISVLNIFDSPPSVMGEVRSPLAGVLMQHYMTMFLADTMLQAERKMLQSVILVERTKETNIDMHYDPNSQSTPNAKSFFTENASNGTGEDEALSMYKLSGRVPEMANMSRAAQHAIRAQQELVARNRSHPLLKNEDAIGGAIIRNHLNKTAEDDAMGDVGRPRYLPKGFQYSSAFKHPEVHAGTRYFEMREQFDRTICSSLEVPIALVKPQPKEASAAQEGQMKIFQRAIQTKARMLNIILTTILRETLIGKQEKFERVFSIKKVTEHYEHISLENNRDRERHLRSRDHVRGGTDLDMSTGNAFARTIPEMIPPYLALPTPSKDEVASVFKVKKTCSVVQSSSEGKGGSSGKDKEGQAQDDRERPPRYFFEDSAKQGKRLLPDRFSGIPVTPLAEIANFQAKEDMYKLIKETHNEYGAEMRRSGVFGERDDEKENKSKLGTDEIDVYHLEVRLEPMVFVNTVDLMETARTGAIPFTQYQRLMAQQIGIVEPPAYGGIYGARENAEFFRVVEGTEVAEKAEAEKEDRNHTREKEMNKINQNNDKDNMVMQNNFQKEQTKLQDGLKNAAERKKELASSSSSSATKKPAAKKKSTGTNSSSSSSSSSKKSTAKPKNSSSSANTKKKTASASASGTLTSKSPSTTTKKRKLQDPHKKASADSSSSSDSDDDAHKKSIKRAAKRRKVDKKSRDM
jgi:hypothetical protein